MKGNKVSPVSEHSVDEERGQESGCRAMRRKEFEGVLFCRAQHRSVQPILHVFLLISHLEKEGKKLTRMKMSNE